MVTATIRFGPFRLVPAERLLERAGRPVTLGGRALDLLLALVYRAAEGGSQRELMDRVWPALVVEGGVLRVHIAGLRKALEEGTDGARYISNVRGRGYCFVASIERSRAEAKPAPFSAMSPLPPRLSRMVG